MGYFRREGTRAINKKIGNNIRRLRCEKKICLEALVAALQYKGHASVLHLESGHSQVKAADLVLLKEFYGVEWEEFFK